MRANCRFIERERYQKNFKKDISEKVYLVDSYYLSQKNTSPEELFNSKWESIYVRFLFSINSNHSFHNTEIEELH